MKPASDAVARTLAYHERTKHHPHRFARSAGVLDWATQPDPFRTYAGAPVLDLPLAADMLGTSFRDLQRPGAVAPHPLDLRSLATFLELSLGLSAWKGIGGERWALRCNPSSGNLHPTEGYVLVPVAPGLPAGLHHYVSRDHVLERRATLDAGGASRLAALLPRGSFLAGLSSIHWREAWKYGERAFRYCQHDVGHAVAALRYAAAALGWEALLLEAGDDRVEHLLGLDRAEDADGIDPLDREQSDLLLLVGANAREAAAAFRLPADLLAGASWAGVPNVLSPAHVRWDAIEEVRSATWGTLEEEPEAESVATHATTPAAAASLPALRDAAEVPAARLFRQRRSGQAFDGRTPFPPDAFVDILDRLLPRDRVPPWDALAWPPQIDVVLFVHRVPGLAPGLYLLPRSRAGELRLRALVRDGAWRRPDGVPEHLPLFLLREGDTQEVAEAISCRQAIAANGAFSLGMLAPLRQSLAERGAPFYRRLFWESGVLGQLLYLEAEAAGGRGTGIGCYFDDLVTRLLGVTGGEAGALESLYHFTIGTPIEDRRLTTLPPYAHLAAARGPRFTGS
jgi:SagB-type dehydrogenase family enzyme